MWFAGRLSRVVAREGLPVDHFMIICNCTFGSLPSIGWIRVNKMK